MRDTEDLLDKNILAPFNDILKAMNISENRLKISIDDIERRLPQLDYDESYNLEFDGLEIDKDFVFELPDNEEPQLYFKYKQRTVIMYQKDQFLTATEYRQQKYRPYHLCFCSALQEAEKNHRYESRYDWTYNTSGRFKVNLSIRDKNSNEVYTQEKEQGIYLPLKVCQHCLREINWKNFRSYCGGGLEWWRGGNYNMRHKIIDEFNLEEYLLVARENNFLDHPVEGTAALSVKKQYVLSPEIKATLKEVNDYTCEICHEKFLPEELQIHHKDHNQQR